MLQRSNTEPLGFSYIFSSANVPRITSVTSRERASWDKNTKRKRIIYGLRSVPQI